MARDKQHWLDIVEEVLLADTGDLRKLAQIAKRDPIYFYRGANLQGADLRGQDLSDIDFTGANLANVLVDKTTRLNEKTLRLIAGNSREGIIEKTAASLIGIDSNVKQRERRDWEGMDASQIISSAENHRRNGDYDEAARILAEYEQLILINENNIITVGQIWEKIDNIRSVKFYITANKSWPNNVDVSRRLAHILVRLGKHTEALVYLAKVYEREPENLEVAISYANSLLKTGSATVAVAVLENILKAFPQRGAVWIRLAKIMVDRQEYASARTVLLEAAERAPESTEIAKTIVKYRDMLEFSADQIVRFVMNGLKSRNLDKFIREAIRTSKKTDILPILEDAIRRENIQERSTSLYKILIAGAMFRGDLDGATLLAREWMRRASSGERVRAQRELATVLLRRESVAEAIALLYDLHHKMTNDPAPAKWLADALVLVGRTKEAIDVLTEAWERYPNNAAALTWLIEQLYDEDRLEEAANLWQKHPYLHRRVSTKTRRMMQELIDRDR